MHLDDQTQSIIHLFICAWACGCIRTHQHLRQISVIWWPELYHQNKLVAFLSLFCLFPSNAKFLWGTWAISSLTADSLLPFFLLILTWSVPADKRSPQSLSELVQLLLRWGVGGVLWRYCDKKSDALFYFSPSRPLVLPFEILMLDGNPLWNCVMLGWVVRSQKWQLYLVITRFWILGYVYVYKKICRPSVWFGC